MSKVIWHTTISLDGFTTGPDDDMSWMTRRPLGPVPLAAETTARVGAILAGRRCYDVGLRDPDQPGAYGGAVTVPTFVLTHNPPATDPKHLRFLTGPIETAVATAKAAAGDKDLMLFGATLATNAIATGLVDEIILHVVPVLLGGGVPMYRHPDHPLDLDLIETLPGPSVTTHRFRPSRR